MSRPMIVAEGLEKHFGTTHALRGLDLDVAEGTILALLGPNGAGKTTVVRILTTLLKPDAGRAEVAGIGIIFMTVFPLTFASSAFVPTDTMPTWLRAFAEHQPLTLVINSVRSFMLTGGGGPDAIPALIWSVGMLAVFFPLGLWLYRRRTSQ